jgi:hypothetical protein
MSTKVENIEVSARPALLTPWTAAVSALAVAALIMSGVALNLAVRGDESLMSRTVEDSSTTEPGRVGALKWDAGKLEAIEGRALAETFRTAGSAPLWDAGKLEAIEGRQLAG